MHSGFKTMGQECPHHAFSPLPLALFAVKFYPLFLVISWTTSTSSCPFSHVHCPILVLFLFPLILCSTSFIYFLWHILTSSTWRTYTYYLFLSSLAYKSPEGSSLYSYLHLSKHLPISGYSIHICYFE